MKNLLAFFTALFFAASLKATVPVQHGQVLKFFSNTEVTSTSFTVDFSIADDPGDLDLVTTQSLQFRNPGGSAVNITVSVTQATMGANPTVTFNCNQDLTGYTLEQSQSLVLVDQTTNLSNSFDYVVIDMIMH